MSTSSIRSAACATAVTLAFLGAWPARADAQAVSYAHWRRIEIPQVPTSASTTDVGMAIDSLTGRLVATAKTLERGAQSHTTYQLDADLGIWTESRRDVDGPAGHAWLFNPSRGRLLAIDAPNLSEWDPPSATWRAFTALPDGQNRMRSTVDATQLRGSAVDFTRGRIFVLAGVSTPISSPDLYEADAAAVDVWTRRCILPPVLARLAFEGVNYTPGGFAFDPTSGTLILHGGEVTYLRGANYVTEAVAATYAYDPATDSWSTLVERSPVPGRRAAAMTHDPSRARMVLAGGYGLATRDTWELDTATRTWTEVRTLATPGPFVAPVFTFDAARGRLVLLGSSSHTGLSGFEMWEYVPGNHAPVVDPVPHAWVRAGERLEVPVAATDADGDPLEFTALNLPAGAVFDMATGTLHWQPQGIQVGSHSVTIQVSDGLETVTVVARIEVMNLPIVDDALEPNDSMASAVLLLGTGRGLFCLSDDWFTLDVPSARDFAVTIAFQHGKGDLDLEMVGPTGKRYASASTGDVETIRVASGAAGTYWIRVFGFRGGSGTYDLTVDGVPVPIATGTIGGSVRPGGTASWYDVPGARKARGRIPHGTPVVIFETRQVAETTFFLVRATVNGAVVQGWLSSRNVVSD